MTRNLIVTVLLLGIMSIPTTTFIIRIIPCVDHEPYHGSKVGKNRTIQRLPYIKGQYNKELKPETDLVTDCSGNKRKI